MKHSGVVFASKFHTNRGQRASSDVISAHEHGDLPRLHDLPLPGFGNQRFPCYIEILADHLLHLVDGEFVLVFAHDVAGYLLSKFLRDFLVAKRRIGYQGDKRSFKLAEIGPDLVGQQIKDIVAYSDALPDLDLSMASLVS